MISSVSGPVLDTGAGWVVVGLGGLGLRVEVPQGRGPVALRGEDILLHTELIVREDALTLFGFESVLELDLFGRLTTVSGVGPRLGLAILSTLAPGEIIAAVRSEEAQPFTRVPGVGPKTAKLLLVSLNGKLDDLDAADGSGEPGLHATGTPADAAAQAVAEGLVGLGWKEADALLAVQQARDAGAPDEHSGLLRAALALIQAPRGGKR